MTSVTTCGCDTMITWEPSASVTAAPARAAMVRRTSLPAALSPVGMTAQDGRLCHAGAEVGSTKPRAEMGRWVAAMTRACSSDTRSEEHTSELQPRQYLAC